MCSPAQGQAVTLDLHKGVSPIHSDLRSLQHLCQGAFSCRDSKPTWAQQRASLRDMLSLGSITEFMMKCRVFLNRKLQGLPGNVCNFSLAPGWACRTRQEGEKSGLVLWVLLLIYLHLQFVLHSSQQTGAAEVQADPLTMRAAPSSAELMLAAVGDCWLSSQPSLAMGSCSWLRSLEASPTPPSTVGPSGLLLSAAISSGWARSLLPQPSPAVQAWLPTHLCCTGGTFWQRARQRATGSSFVRALLTGIQFFQGRHKPYIGILQFYLISNARCAQQCHSFTTI